MSNAADSVVEVEGLVRVEPCVTCAHDNPIISNDKTNVEDVRSGTGYSPESAPVKAPVIVPMVLIILILYFLYAIARQFNRHEIVITPRCIH
jgi:hypothetical protein